MTMEWENTVKLVDDILMEIAFAMAEGVDVVDVRNFLTDEGQATK